MILPPAFCAIGASMNSRLLEIREAIDAHLRAILNLRAEESVIISARFRLPGPMLEFDADGRTIRWIGGEVVLGKKPYKFVKSLYDADNHRLRIEKITRTVWGGRYTAHATIKMTVSNLCRQLSAAKFPYEIESVKNKMRVENVKNPVSGEIKKIIIQPEIKGFRLGVKK